MALLPIVPRPLIQFRPLGLVLIAVAVLLPLVWFVPLAARDPIAVAGQYFGSLALILMGLSQFMATRWPGVEVVFGGMDRVYVLHKWTGIAVIAFILLHDAVGAEIRGLGDKSALEDFAKTLGEFSYYGFLILAGLSIAMIIPYSLWRWTHRFMGAFFALSAFHFAFIAKPFSLTDPPGLYVGAFCVLGLVSYAYTLLPLRRWLAARAFVVEAVERTGGALAVTLAPKGGNLRHRAGQFAFLRFGLPGLGEAHPFTISSAPRADGKLRFSIKSPGDWSSELPYKLQAGVAVWVDGPYGHFTRRTSAVADIWIAGGIGITPFLAWAGAMLPESPDAHLFYSVRNRADAPHLDQLEALASQKPNLHLHLIESAVTGRLDAGYIQQATGADLRRTHVYFCGPTAMREGLQDGLERLGLRAARFHYERFEMRTGIGLWRLVVWSADAILQRLARKPAVGGQK